MDFVRALTDRDGFEMDRRSAPQSVATSKEDDVSLISCARFKSFFLSVGVLLDGSAKLFGT
jgi:hypothetical protein